MAMPKGEKLDFDLATERRKRGLTQRDLAKAIGCSYEAIRVWEIGKCNPMADHKRTLLEFLANKPVLRVASWSAKELCDHINEMRESHGISLNKLSKQIGINNATLQHWFTSKNVPSPSTYRKLEAFFYPENNSGDEHE